MKQSYENLSTKATEVVAEEITKVQTRIEQGSETRQEILDMTVELPPAGYCSFWQEPSLVISQSQVNAGVVGTSLNLMNSTDLTAKIAATIQNVASATVNKEKDGMLAFTDGTNIDQSVKISETTLTSIRNRVERAIETLIGQKMKSSQSIQRLRIIMPCGGVVVNQQSVTQMMAKDIASAGVEAFLQSDDARAYLTKMDAQDNQKSTDFLNSVSNTVRSVANNLTDNLGMSLSAGFLAVGLIGIAIIFLAPSILGALLGGGGGGGRRRKRRRDDDD